MLFHNLSVPALGNFDDIILLGVFEAKILEKHVFREIAAGEEGLDHSLNFNDLIVVDFSASTHTSSIQFFSPLHGRGKDIIVCSESIHGRSILLMFIDGMFVCVVDFE